MVAHAGPAPAIFLPGIVLPASSRYAPLIEALGDSVRPVVKDLEVYAGQTPPANYAIEQEVEGIARAADAAGFDRFHLYGHSAGGACALAYVAADPDRVLSLALDEPATDFSPVDLAGHRAAVAEVNLLPPAERVGAFLRMQVATGVELPPPPPGPPPPWMERRPAGIDAFTDAIQRHHVSPERYRQFTRPVYYSYGSLSSPTWIAMRDRLAGIFPDFTADEYEGAHHMRTSHHHDPARVAAALRRLWGQTA